MTGAITGYGAGKEDRGQLPSRTPQESRIVPSTRKTRRRAAAGLRSGITTDLFAAAAVSPTSPPNTHRPSRR